MKNYLKIFSKRFFTNLRLRNKQSCKYCGRNQNIIWNVSNEIWTKLPPKYHNKCLCLECFMKMINNTYKLNILIKQFKLEIFN